MTDDVITIPVERLSDDLLQAVIEEFITREGTDYGHQDFSLEQKVAQVKKQIAAGRVQIVFDPQTESCTLLSTEG